MNKTTPNKSCYCPGSLKIYSDIQTRRHKNIICTGKRTGIRISEDINELDFAVMNYEKVHRR